MKSFRQFITEENKEELTRLALIDALNTIKNDCQQFLHRVAKAGKFHSLYRGMPESWPNYEVNVRKNKSPIATPKKVADAFDRVMQEKYHREFRTDSIIVTGDPSKISNGIKHLIFPIGKFDYLWSEKIKDLVVGFGTEADLDDGKGLYFDIDEADSEKNQDKVVKEFLDKNQFVHNERLSECVDKGNHVMIDCNYYYAIPAQLIYDQYETFSKMIGEIHFMKSMKNDLLVAK